MSASDNPGWMQPLWRRIAIVAVCAVWAAVEAYNGAPGWALAFAAMALYGAWTYLYKWENPGEPSRDPKE